MTTLNARPTAVPPAAQNREAVVRCIKVSKMFRDFWLRNRVRAVEAIDLDIYRGEIFGLLGPNGSGKSTTIKMILGLLYPTAGRITVFGKMPHDVETKKIIGYLPEESYLYRFLNARETLDYYGRLFHLPSDVRKRRIDMLLDMVGLEGVQNRPIGEYSKGMQRRIGLAQALINDPQLLVLDEPTTGMDPIGSRQIKDLIKELGRRGKTILLCSHMLSDVEDVCDRVAIMFGGKVREQGTCDELLVRHDRTTINTQPLDAQVLSEIQAVLAKHGMQNGLIEHPRQKLEELFLEIVERAHKEGHQTSGAKNTGKIADFLVTGEQAEGQAVIDNLIAKPAAPAKAAPGPAKPADFAAQSVVQELIDKPVVKPKTDEAPKDATDHAVIDDLINPGDKK
jgi:ABC-2 type transport system ATP-binding protein